MFGLVFLCSAFALELPDYFHTSEEILSTLDSLECPNLENISLDPTHTYTYTSNSSFKTFILFGEHARELISPELGLALIQRLCDTLYEESDFLLVVNANPVSRKKVEEGDWCLRTNENGVDLNRNWDIYWEPSDCEESPNTCPGPYPFSEAETQQMRDLLEDFQPDLFLSIHSGIEAIFMPYAYTIELADEPALEAVLKGIKDTHCPSCAFGSPAEVLGYEAHGSCVDYAYIVEKIKYSAVFEIFEEDSLFGTPSFLQESLEGLDCYFHFNPEREKQFDAYLRAWTNAILDLVESVKANK